MCIKNCIHLHSDVNVNEAAKRSAQPCVVYVFKLSVAQRFKAYPNNLEFFLMDSQSIPKYEN